MLRQVAAETLERKRRLVHYAVIWRDGEVLALGGDDAPPHLRRVASLEAELEQGQEKDAPEQSHTRQTPTTSASQSEK